MKQITIAGRVTKDAELRQAGNDQVLGFSVAVDDRQGREKATIFFECSLWGKRGEALQTYIKKGDPITVSGDLSKRDNDGKTYLGIRVDQVTLQGSAGGGGSERQEQPKGNAVKESYDLNDDIPFIVW